MSGIALSHDLIDRLRVAFPQTVVGIKDSAGKLDNMVAMIARFPGFSVLAGADPLLLQLMQIGGAGSITATSNLAARELALVYRATNDPAQADTVAQAQARIEAFRNLSNSYVQLPAIKGMIRFQTGVAGWSRMRPPLMDLTPAERADLRAKLLTIGATVTGN